MPNWKYIRHQWVAYNGRQREQYYVYSPNMGTIKNFVASMSPYGGMLYVDCNDVTYYITQNSTATRARSMMILHFEVDLEDGANANSYSKAVEKEKSEIQTQTNEVRAILHNHNYISSLFTTDPRLLRAHILMWYEEFKETPPEKINELLNKSVDLSITDAKEWLRRNDFRYSEELYWFKLNTPNSRYLNDAAVLRDPYWLP